MAPRSRRGRRWLRRRAGLEHLTHRLRGCIYHLGLIRWSRACRRMGHRRAHCPSRCRCPPPTRLRLRSRPIEFRRQRLSACSLARKCDEPRLAEPRTCVWCQGMGRGVLVGRMDGWTKALRRRARWTHTSGSTLTAHGATTMNHPPVLKAQGVRVLTPPPQSLEGPLLMSNY
jgi:hypothetical protein